MTLLSLEGVGVELDETNILQNIGFSLEAGTWTGLIGPNGSGKTTLLRAVGAHIPYDGRILLDGYPVADWSAQERARRLAFVRQASSLTFDFTVEEFVLLGRAPHRGWLTAYGGDDRQRVQEALSRVDLDGFASRSVLSLSGGELQRAFLAQALVQETELLMLDEPTSHLDVYYQFSFMDQVERLVQRGQTVLAVFHDLELAARYADRLLVLQEGRLVADGQPAEVLTSACIADVFGMQARIHRRPDGTLRVEYLAPVSGATKKTADPQVPSPASG